MIDIQAPGEALIGDEVVLNASETFDWDGDRIEFSWVQFHNLDRYTGKEYVTGNDVILTTPDGARSAEYPDSLSGTAVVKFLPRWPGNYRFELTATDKDGERHESVDVLVRPLEDRFEIKGMAVDWYANPNQLTLVRYKQLLEAIAHAGANFIEIPVEACMPSMDSNEIFSYPGVDPNPHGCIGNLSDQFLRDMIRLAKDRGLGVLLAPQTNGFGEGGAFFWTGNIQPQSWDAWFSNYEAFIGHYAHIAEEEGVDIFQLGNEYNSSQHMTERWEEVISLVRGVYSGDLTYGVTNIWFSGQNPVSFWSDLDYVGLHFYYPATGNQYPIQPGVVPALSTHPSVQQMADSFDEQMKWTLDRIAQDAGKPVLVTELCAGNYDGSNSTHFSSGSQLDNAEQYEFYEAALRVLSSRDYLRGVFIWALEWRETHSSNMGISPLNKPAIDLIGLYFK